jgi:hypothetical protein
MAVQRKLVAGNHYLSGTIIIKPERLHSAGTYQTLSSADIPLGGSHPAGVLVPSAFHQLAARAHEPQPISKR